jgi:carboxyl-terminal processing protease
VPYDEGTEKYYKAIVERLEKGELFHEDSVHFPDSLKYHTSGGRLVYGGGAVMPDFFVPIDTGSSSDYYAKLIRKGIFNNFTFDYADQQREDLKKKFPDFTSFEHGFVVDKKLLIDFGDYAEEKKVDKDPKGMKASEEWIALQIKAWLARQLWGIQEYFRVVNPTSPEYQKAIEIISDDTFDRMGILY